MLTLSLVLVQMSDVSNPATLIFIKLRISSLNPKTVIWTKFLKKSKKKNLNLKS